MKKYTKIAVRGYLVEALWPEQLIFSLDTAFTTCLCGRVFYSEYCAVHLMCKNMSLLFDGIDSKAVAVVVILGSMT